MVPASAQGGADACAAIEAKNTGAVHGRTAPPRSTTQARTQEDRRGQDDDRSRRRNTGDHPTGPQISVPLTSRDANQATRGPRFEGMERMFGKAEDPPSDAAGTPVGPGSFRSQARRTPHPITRWS